MDEIEISPLGVPLAEEVRMLQTFAERLNVRRPDLRCQLDHFEHGYVRLKIMVGGAERPVAELHIVIDPEKDAGIRFGLYVFSDGGEKELLFDGPDEGIDWLPRAGLATADPTSVDCAPEDKK